MKKNFIDKQKAMQKISSICMIFLLLLCATAAFGQSGTVTGTVTDATGEPLIGVNIMVKGTTVGVITDIDGKYSLQPVTNQSTLVFSYVGYLSEEVVLGAQRTLNMQLRDDTQSLDEIVVVGYGTQARRDISGSITTVSAADLKEMPVTTFAEALMGQAAGVYVSATGAPGAATTMRIRGVGSVNTGAAGPLVIVDGVSNVAVETINPNDIENFSILKDASATAIYGARGANGVILITTKQGSKEGRVRVAYDGYVGLSTMANNGFDILDAWEYMDFIGQGMINQRDVRGIKEPAQHPQFGALNSNDKLTMPYATNPAGFSREQVIDRWGSVDNWVASYLPNGGSSWARSAYAQMLEDGYSEAEARKGTNWYNEIVRKGMLQNHNLSLQGGNGDKGMYSVTLGVNMSEGTIKSSFFNRYNLRANSIFNPSKYLSFGFNISLMASEQGGDRGSNSHGNIFQKTYSTQPWVPVYSVNPEYFSGTQSNGGGENSTPVSVIDSQEKSTNRTFNGNVSVFAEVKPIAGLTIRTQYAPTLTGGWETSFSPITIMHNKEGRGNNQYSETARHSFGWQWTNTVNYNTSFNMDHRLDIVAGTEAIDQNRFGRTLGATRIDYVFENDPNTWQINNGSSSNLSNSGSMSTHTSLFGYFGRAEYSYKGTYILNASIRRDASSRFSEKNRWGTFPSISAAWRVSDEAFMQSTKRFIDDFKFRVGYGTTGNSNTGNDNAYNWASPFGTGNTYLYSITGSNTSVYTGYHITSLGDDLAKWETMRTLNVGIDVTALKQRLTTSIEWYTRRTSDMLVGADWSALAGGANINNFFPRVNIGDMDNRGVDFSVSWRDRTRLFRYNISANVSTYRNKAVKLGSADIFSSATFLPPVCITREGLPISQFYGYKVEGIYKNLEEVLNGPLPFGAPSWDAITDNDNEIAKGYIGRYKIADVDGSGFVDADDRTILGNPHPDFTGGLNANIQFRNFDLSTAFYFSVGNDIFKQYHYFNLYGALSSNYLREKRDESWHPTENPNGKYPLWLAANLEGDEAANYVHSMYVEDGSYLRMRTLTLGYSLPRNILRATGLERVRIYAQVSNVFTLTKYSGLEPEIRSSNQLNMGIDFGGYGIPRQYLLGVNISFQ